SASLGVRIAAFPSATWYTFDGLVAMKLYRPIFSLPTTLSSKNACASRPSNSNAVTGVSRSARSCRYTGTMSAVCALLVKVGRSGKYLRIGGIVAGRGAGGTARSGLVKEPMPNIPPRPVTDLLIDLVRRRAVDVGEQEAR